MPDSEDCEDFDPEVWSDYITSAYLQMEYVPSIFPDNSESDEPLVPLTVFYTHDDDSPPENIYCETFDQPFWTYGKNEKGPKPKVYKKPNLEWKSPHDALIYKDPVFDSAYSSEISHNGKGRIGNGNDILPRPQRLHTLGQEIKELEVKIRTLADKDKSSQNSRLCRLKRKANHEANKIIFSGLEKERAELSKVIRLIEAEISKGDSNQSLHQFCQQTKEQIMNTFVAGRRNDYVYQSIKKP